MTKGGCRIFVFLGPPGSGKGTQAKMLADKLGMPHISLGDILREEVRAGSEIGKTAKQFIDAGKLVPDEVTIQITRERITRKDCVNGLILDGFPRSPVQAEAFDEMLEDLSLELEKVIYFRVSEDDVVLRLSGRRSCKSCGAVFHVDFNPPKVAGKCDICGGELYLRKDDEESAIRTRFEVYEDQTKPLIDRYARKGKMAAVEAGKKIEAVFSDLLKIVGDGTN